MGAVRLYLFGNVVFGVSCVIFFFSAWFRENWLPYRILFFSMGRGFGGVFEPHRSRFLSHREDSTKGRAKPNDTDDEPHRFYPPLPLIVDWPDSYWRSDHCTVLPLSRNL